MDDGGALVLDVVEAGLLADRAGLGRAQVELEPEGPCGRLDRLTGVSRGRRLVPEDVDEVDRLVDLRERGDARDAEHFLAVEGPDGDDPIAVVQEVAHDAVARPGGVR